MTREQLDALRTPKGGWTKATLEKIGVPWPPPKGWRRKLIKEGESIAGDRRFVSVEEYKALAEKVQRLETENAALQAILDSRDGD